MEFLFIRFTYLQQGALENGPPAPLQLVEKVCFRNEVHRLEEWTQKWYPKRGGGEAISSSFATKLANIKTSSR